MTEYTVKLTETENLAFSYVAVSQQDWIDNVVHERCRLAIEEVVQISVAKCLESGVQIPSSKDELVSIAFENNWVKSAVIRNAEHLENAAQISQQGA